VGKEETFVLDLCNERKNPGSFRPYYEVPLVEQQQSRIALHLQAKRGRHGLHATKGGVCEGVLFKPEEYADAERPPQCTCFSLSVERFVNFEPEKQDFSGTVDSLQILYAFLSQIIPFNNSDREKLYSFIRC